MSGLNLEDLHKKLYNNTIKIRSIEKENKSIVDSINLLNTLNKYDDDKLDNLDLQLKEIVELQKKMNLELTKKVCEGKKDNITNKYLNLPYDINEIIRNKIKKDSKLQFKYNHIDKCFKLIESKFQRQMLYQIANMTYIYYNNPDNSRVDWLRLRQLADWNELFEKLITLNGDKWYYWIGEFSNIHISQFDLQDTKKLLYECRDYITKKFRDLEEDYETLKDCIGNLFNLVEEKEYGDNKWFVSCFHDWSSGDFIRVRNSNGKKNGMGYKKLKKCINSILYTYLSDKNEDDYIIDIDTYEGWDNNTCWGFNQSSPISFYDVYNSNYELVEESCKNGRYN